MAVFRSLRVLTRNSTNFSLYSPTPFSTRYNPYSYFFGSTTFLSPISKWMKMIPLHAPLFLSSSPWMLSQSATPIYFQSDVILSLPKLAASDMLQMRNRKFPTNLGYVSTPTLLDGIYKKEFIHAEVNVSRDDGSKERFFNLPNMISISRLLSGPVLGWMITNDMYMSAFIGLGISGATDWLDGYLARKMRINSVVGSYLDPLADKVLIGCVALAMVDQGLLHTGLVAMVVGRDVALVGGAIYKRASSFDWKRDSLHDFFYLDGTQSEKVEPLLISKVNTVFQLVLVAAGLLQPVFGTAETEPCITYLSWLVASTTLLSTVAYGAQHVKNRSMLLRKNA